MSKLEKLTNEQEKLMEVVKNEWINFVLNSNAPMDKPAVKQGINWMYGLAKLDSPEVAFAESPLACQIIANLYGNKKIRDSVGARRWHTVAASRGMPFGTRIHIPALGKAFVVQDRGGAIKQSHRLDLYVEDRQSALKFGRRKLEGVMLE